MLSGDQIEHIHFLIEDVNIIEKLLFVGEPLPHEARAILVPILRKWICDKNFYVVQKLIYPEKVKFNIFSASKAIKLCKAGYLVEWMGMLSFKGVGIGTSRIAPKHLTNKPEMIGEAVFPTLQDAKSFFEQRVLFMDNAFYTREEIISGHANKLGGVHIDFKRSEKNKYIDKAKNHFGLEVKPNNLQIMLGDEISAAKQDAQRRDNVYNALEIVAIDTARIFASGIRSAMNILEAKLKAK